MTPLLLALFIVVIAWFALGTIWNIRKGSAVMRWMQGGLPLIGERTTARWLGTTAVEMVLNKPKPPFQQVTLVIFMEPRDVPWFWGLARLQGRRDTLIIRAQLRAVPHADFEAVDKTSWSGRDSLNRIESERWSVAEPADGNPLTVYYKTDAALDRAKDLIGLAQQSGFVVRRLSVRHAEPHLQLHLALPPDTTPAHSFFQSVIGLGERAGG